MPPAGAIYEARVSSFCSGALCGFNTVYFLYLLSVPYAQVCLPSQEPSLGCTLKTANIAVYTHSLAFLNNEMATVSHENCIH